MANHAGAQTLEDDPLSPAHLRAWFLSGLVAGLFRNRPSIARWTSDSEFRLVQRSRATVQGVTRGELAKGLRWTSYELRSALEEAVAYGWIVQLGRGRHVRYAPGPDLDSITG